MSKRRSATILAAVTAGVLAVSAAVAYQVTDRQLVLPGTATVRAYLRLEGIEGEATARGHENWIEVLDFDWGVFNDIPTAGTQIVAGSRVDFQDLVVRKRIDKASPSLAVLCAAGGAIGEGELVFYVGSNENPTGIVSLTQLRVRSVASASGSSSGSSEVLSLTFSTVEWTYYWYDDRGRSGETRAGWDVRENRRL
jgi:type VI secretion system secreted protein Hcp